MTTTLPPGPTAPRAVQGIRALLSTRLGLDRLRERYGDAFTVNVPLFGRAVILSNPGEIKQLFTASPEQIDTPDVNLGRVLGPGSFFAISGKQHHAQRKLLIPPFHGRRLAAYEEIIEQETLRELAAWPRGREFATLPPMMRITLNVILRAVFGAEGAESDRLRELLPRFVTLGSRLAVAPIPRNGLGRWNPWHRFASMRAEYDALVAALITRAERDADLDERNDVLALMVQARYDDGTAMSREDIADQLFTLLSAGHETTATTLAWTVERLRRHPDVLRALAEEADGDDNELRTATITEVQRSRPVIDTTARQVKADSLRLGRWTIPRGYSVVAGIALIHHDETLFPNARTFDPQRFVGAKPDLYQWIPFGGGDRRCIGAAFAAREMDIVLRTMLREISLAPTEELGERWRSRGVANAPAKGGRAVVHNRPSTSDTPS